MGRTVKREIIVNDQVYIWTLKGNSIYGKGEHIKVHSKKTPFILYIDPYDWVFEIQPKTIRAAILFAIKNDWETDYVKKHMYISMNNSTFVLLSGGIRFKHELNN